ncbi:MAG: lysine--tRNA ligase [Verrucomicrobiales bacterium]|jgi:lysyl-tRNA synthetase class 2|nr:lysine--tRNA ligase [Verrucomicrobiales bacterium]|tara:strand:- start:1458 stop:2942 length:1485 start_codon:yes stop_codon:yes gene_type:complete
MSDEENKSTEEELIAVRREKLNRLRELGVNPYGERFLIDKEIDELSESFTEGSKVVVAGRITAHRDMGKSHFFDISDFKGRIQCYLNAKAVGEESFEIFKQLDLGDWIGIEGETFKTKVGEPTVKVESFKVLSKSLRPLPDKYHGLSDKETRYRQRYLDLVSNEASRNVFLKRSLIVREIRDFLQDRGFIEVETPMLQDVPGGAAARPFETHHNALNMPLYMRIAPELFLKRLLVGGMTKVFELNRNFRNEGISRRHNPEFTMLEAYWAYADFEAMADLVEEMVCSVAEKYCGGLNIETKDEDGNVTKNINLSRPWKRAPYKELIKDVAGQDWFEFTSDQRREKCAELGVEISEQMEDYEVTQQVFEKLVEEKTFDPLYVTHVPKELVPLAKQNTDDDSLVDVYELIINGQEISPGYSELNDPDIQRQRLMDQAGEETQKVDEEFLTALEHGMPPAGGIGIGIDRLVIMLTSAESIRDVVLFPQLKKSGDEENS